MWTNSDLALCSLQLYSCNKVISKTRVREVTYKAKATEDVGYRHKQYTQSYTQKGTVLNRVSQDKLL